MWFDKVLNRKKSIPAGAGGEWTAIPSWLHQPPATLSPHCVRRCIEEKKTCLYIQGWLQKKEQFCG
jgi:hypothetical protein